MKFILNNYGYIRLLYANIIIMANISKDTCIYNGLTVLSSSVVNGNFVYMHLQKRREKLNNNKQIGQAISLIS